MFRIDTPNKSVNLFGAGKHGFRDGDKAAGINATELSAAQQNALQEELAAVIETAGNTLNKANNAQLIAAIQSLITNRNIAGLVRSMTPIGGGMVREYADVTNAATVGGIEIGIAYNCAVNTTTGVWAGRDVVGSCWLEKWHDTAGTKEIWIAPTAAAGVVPAWVSALTLNANNGNMSISGTMVADAATLSTQLTTLGQCDARYLQQDGDTGLIRTLTPAGGARVRELGDITNAATVGGIEFGTSYNCNINQATGAWAGRDVADICWLEKWHDTAGTKEFWFAPTGAANSVPVWTKIFAIDMVNGTVTQPTPAQFDNTTKAATTAFVRSELLGLGNAAYAALFGASLATSGYQKLPSGLIIQFGMGATNASGVATVTWPITFPTAVLFAGAYLNNANNSTVQSNTPTTTGCNVTSYAANTGAGQANNFRHLSIGY